MEKWEYKSFKVETSGFAGGIVDIEDFNDKLNELGGQGWELVSSVSTNMGHGATRDVVAIFKRKNKVVFKTNNPNEFTYSLGLF